MKKMNLFFVLTLIFLSCRPSTVKEKINKAGDVAGQTAGEFFEGVTKGVQKAFDVEITLPEDLKAKGIEFGKTTISSDSVGTDNQLNLYVIFNKNVDADLLAKVYDDQSKEIGRSKLSIKGKKDEAKFFHFHFDANTNIDSKNKIVVE